MAVSVNTGNFPDASMNAKRSARQTRIDQRLAEYVPVLRHASGPAIEHEVPAEADAASSGS